VLQEHKPGRVAPYRRRLTAFLRACSHHQSDAGRSPEATVLRRHEWPSQPG
jgi:hypothetical protein